MTTRSLLETLKSFTTYKPYLSREAAAGLKQYRYTGGDTGILYRFFYNPLAISLVQIMPENLA